MCFSCPELSWPDWNARLHLWLCVSCVFLGSRFPQLHKNVSGFLALVYLIFCSFHCWALHRTEPSSTQIPTLLLGLKIMGFLPRSEKDDENFRKMLVFDCWKKIDWQGKNLQLDLSAEICFLWLLSWASGIPPFLSPNYSITAIKVRIRGKLVLNLSQGTITFHHNLFTVSIFKKPQQTHQKTRRFYFVDYIQTFKFIMEVIN